MNMPEFLKLIPPQDALKEFFEHIPAHVKIETIDTLSSLGRVTAEPIVAPHPLPTFPRSTVDGYAVLAEDTYGTSESLPTYLKISGEILMGNQTSISLMKGQCAIIHTGGMLPTGANAVVMLENTQQINGNEIEVLRSVAIGENIIKIGEDVADGQIVIPLGTLVRPPEIGGMMALGITHLKAALPPRVAIISTGDEVIPPDMDLQLGQVRDVNTYTLSALITQVGGYPHAYGIIPDEKDLLQGVADKALTECDILVIAAGSSASMRDLTVNIISDLGKPGVLVHGVNLRPGKPTILGVCNEKPVLGLPGNPVSALVTAQIFLVPVIKTLLGMNLNHPRAIISARLTLNVASQAGREDWVPVRLITNASGYLAEPIFGKSNLIFTLVRATGLVRIPPDLTGLAVDDNVEVILL
jgi:molybdopterin molybdotransferase